MTGAVRLPRKPYVVPTSTARYDLALGLIPLAFVLAMTLGTVLGLSVQATLVSAALVGVVVLVDALYLNPPVERGFG